jgi:DNA-binding CsgD family transcriptional regulator
MVVLLLFKNTLVANRCEPDNTLSFRKLGPEMDKADRIRTLTKKEANVLYLICQGYTNPDIGKILDIEPKTLSSRLTKIYEKLQIEGKGDEKRQRLITEYCKTVKEVVSEENLKTWNPILPTEEKEANRYAIIERKYPDDLQDMTPPNTEPSGGNGGGTGGGNGVTYIDKRECDRRVRRWVLFFSVVIGLLLLIIVILLKRPPEPPLIPADTPENTTEAAISGGDSLITTTFTPEPSLTPTATITSTPPPTPTATSIPTQTKTPTPTEALLFEDNFDMGMADGWNIQYGEVVLSQGNLSALEFLWLSVGEGWTNYQLDMDIYIGGPHAGPDNPPHIVPRLTDWQNYIGYKMCRTYGYSYWVEAVNGAISKIPNTENYGVSAYKWYHLTLYVEGDFYAINIDGVRVSSFITNKYPSGSLGLYLDVNEMIDNVRIVALP